VQKVYFPLLGIFGGIAELPSSLELVQAVHDDFIAANNPIEHPFSLAFQVSSPLLWRRTSRFDSWMKKNFGSF
jgi:hypothetical protein